MTPKVTVDAYELETLCDAARMLDEVVKLFLDGDVRMKVLQDAKFSDHERRVLERLGEAAA